ncbi:MAG: hypothetical protein LBL08_02670 [Candidatus Nomurabacteria bacterium]|jgi:hypothetical protein|nr:hypothetical protein [Candidatus Nomurabacteria bacterium]
MPKYNVVVKTTVNNRPKDHEMAAAIILAKHFKTDIIFLRPTANKTPDFDINDVIWELKSPIGNGKRTIQNNLREARRQSSNIVLDLTRIKLHEQRAISQINYILKTHTVRSIKHLMVIKRSKKVVELL